MTVSAEREAAERAIATYERHGYLVERDVTLSSLDSRLPNNIKIDFVASKGDELVLVEVKGRESLSAAPLTQIAEAASLLTNARAELVWTGASAPIPNESAIARYAAQVPAVFLVDPAAGLLLAWTALENAVRRIALDQDIEPAAASRQALTNLYGNRIISWTAYSRLMKLSRTRDAVANSQPVEIPEKDIALIQDYVQFFTSSSFLPYDDALAIAGKFLASPDATGHLSSNSGYVTETGATHQLRRVLPASMPAGDVDELLNEITNGAHQIDHMFNHEPRRLPAVHVGASGEQTETSTRRTATLSQPANKVDKAYEAKSVVELADAPVDALQGVSEADAEHLKAAFNIKTVRDLGTNKYFLWAQAITKLAD